MFFNLTQAAAPYKIGTGLLFSSTATSVKVPLIALSRSNEYISSIYISTKTRTLLLPVCITLPINSLMVPAGIGLVKSILSDDTVTIRLRANLVAAINATSSIKAMAVPPNKVS